jgi:hypothetical protein
LLLNTRDTTNDGARSTCTLICIFSVRNTEDTRALELRGTISASLDRLEQVLFEENHGIPANRELPPCRLLSSI